MISFPQRLAPAGAICVLSLVLLSGPAHAQSASVYQGRAVSDVLRDFQKAGVRIVFSDALVRSTLRVLQESTAETPREIIDAILAPHRLAVRVGPAGMLLVVRAPVPAISLDQLPTPTPRSTGSIEGVVLNQQTRRPVASAIVSIEATGASISTTDDGRFRFEDVLEATHTIRVDAATYETLANPELKVTRDRTATLVLELRASTAFSETVTVTGVAAPRPANVTTSGYNLV